MISLITSSTTDP